ncbi:hypothetical protein KR018_001487 [Drosophila ironensis]|nr:hypothetical protein KR018_001487 [Drosophila ironensis]
MKNRKLRCIVEHCHENGHQDSRSMFKFPTNPVIRLKWLENIGISKDSNVYNRRVCRRHFEPQCFGKAKLFSWAVPTLFLGTSEALHFGSPKNKPFIRKCSLKNCPTRSPPDRLHLFPSDPQMHKKWLSLCNLKGDNKWLFICGRHFRPSLLPNRNSKVPRDAVPELYLGWEAPDPLESMPNLVEKEKPSRSEDEGIDEDSSKGTCELQGSCSDCPSLKEQLAAALARIKKLEKLQTNPAESDDEEDEYIFMLMK